MVGLVRKDRETLECIFERIYFLKPKVQLLAMDILALVTMKNAAKCDT